jgi:endoglucanase
VIRTTASRHSAPALACYFVVAVLSSFALSACVGAKAASAGGASEFDECAQGMIDDLEDGNGQILPLEERAGYWYTFADEEGTTILPDGELVPAKGGAAGSQLAARIKGKTADERNVWAGMAFSLTNPKGTYDVSRYKGISFYARKGKGSTAVMVFRMPDANSDPQGGVCKSCWNDFAAQLTLTDHWQKFVLPFSELKQEPGWGERHEEPALDKVFELRWQIKTRNVDYDIWVDQIRFVGCPEK